MTEITIVVSPAFDRRGKRRHGRFDVRLQGGDEVICEATQQPLLDASRVLLQRGADPTTTICKVRADAPTIVTMRAPIGVAAQYDVMGSAFVRRKPDAGPMPGSGIENGVSTEPRVLCMTEANAGALHNGSTSVATPSSTSSTAAKITVDESKTRFARWKALSLSAVAPRMRFPSVVATPVAPDAGDTPQPPVVSLPDDVEEYPK